MLKSATAHKMSSAEVKLMALSAERTLMLVTLPSCAADASEATQAQASTNEEAERKGVSECAVVAKSKCVKGLTRHADNNVRCEGEAESGSGMRRDVTGKLEQTLSHATQARRQRRSRRDTECRGEGGRERRGDAF